MRREKSYRGISKRLAIYYLEGLGGQAVDEQGVPVEGAGETQAAAADVDRVEADEWTASLSTDVVAIGPTVQLTEVTVVFEGDDAVVEELTETFSKKAMRAGG